MEKSDQIKVLIEDYLLKKHHESFQEHLQLDCWKRKFFSTLAMLYLAIVTLPNPAECVFQQL